ncbi:haloacid dehalogenase-like hydrolase [Nannochloropsis oceanica]
MRPFGNALLLLVLIPAMLMTHAFLLPASVLSSSKSISASRERQQQPRGGAAMRLYTGGPAASQDWALIFDCDGVILESESLHREAYNAMFREFQISYHWNEEYYDELQNKIGGGIPKMRYYFGEHGWPSSSLGSSPPSSSEDKEKMLNTLQDRKTGIYKDMIRGGTAQVRPGVLRLIKEARALKEGGREGGAPKLAICSASTKTSCLFVLDNLLGEEVLQNFDLILAGDDVKNRKPDPEIYSMASERLGIPASRSVVIEDSLIGLQAALGAKMPCIITSTPSTRGQDFTAAHAVFTELGDGDGIQVTAKQLRDIALGNSKGFGK